jgi:hypothetical protein
MTTLRSPRLRRRGIKFTPSAASGSTGAKLEERSLAAPAVFYQPTPTPVLGVDWIQATAGGGGQSGTTGNQIVNTGTASATSHTTGFGPLGTGYTQTGSAMSQLVGTPDPGRGNPIGNSTMGINTALNVGFGSSQEAIGNFSSLEAQGRIPFQLANTPAIPTGGPVMIVEHFNVTYSPDKSTPGQNANNTNVTVTIGSPGFTVALQGVDSWSNVTVGGVNETTRPTGTITGFGAFGSTITYGFSADAFTATIDTPATGILPNSARLASGALTGIAWPVNWDSRLGLFRISGQGGGNGALSNLTTHYDIGFITQ